MIPNDPALTFAVTLKRWFASNGWPQKITDDWAQDVGNATGPWASQVCNAFKAAGYNPKAEFFLALGTFNQAVASQELLAIKDTKLKDRLTGALPLLLENGQPYGGAEFWSLYAGLIEPPAAFFNASEALTQEDIDEWAKRITENFRLVSLKHMVSRGEAWQLIMAEFDKWSERQDTIIPPDDIQLVQEVILGLTEPTLEKIGPMLKRYPDGCPLTDAYEVLLGGEAKKHSVIA
tara:strand:- start:1410 stop:2111 length:702 start_codon:yes stop_codon:yes gene_type:complete